MLHAQAVLTPFFRRLSLTMLRIPLNFVKLMITTKRETVGIYLKELRRQAFVNPVLYQLCALPPMREV
jgi:hypothetical protein